MYASILLHTPDHQPPERWQLSLGHNGTTSRNYHNESWITSYSVHYVYSIVGNVPLHPTGLGLDLHFPRMIATSRSRAMHLGIPRWWRLVFHQKLLGSSHPLSFPLWSQLQQHFNRYWLAVNVRVGDRWLHRFTFLAWPNILNRIATTTVYCLYIALRNIGLVSIV